MTHGEMDTLDRRLTRIEVRLEAVEKTLTHLVDVTEQHHTQLVSWRVARLLAIWVIGIGIALYAASTTGN